MFNSFINLFPSLPPNIFLLLPNNNHRIILYNSHQRDDCVVRLYMIEGEYNLRWIEWTANGILLVSPNPDVPDIRVNKGKTIERVVVLTHRLKKISNYQRQYGGYPVNAAGYMEKGMDYNQYFLGKDGYWETHFYLRVDGESMSGDGIVKNNLLVVDKLAKAYNDSILVFLIENNYTLKRIVKHKEYIELIGSNPTFPRIWVEKGTRLEPWGVLTGMVTEYLKNYEILYSCSYVNLYITHIMESK